MEFNREIVAKLAHDIKGSIGNVMMFSELMLDSLNMQDGEDPKQVLESVRDIAANIHLTADRFLETIDSWTDLYAFAIEGIHPKGQEVNVEPLLVEVGKRSQDYAEKKEINVTYECAPELQVYFDAHLISQILNGLMAAIVMYAEFKSTIHISAKPNGARGRFSISFTTKSSVEIFSRLFMTDVKLDDPTVYKQGVLKPAVVHPMLANIVLTAIKAPHGYEQGENGLHVIWFELTML